MNYICGLFLPQVVFPSIPPHQNGTESIDYLGKCLLRALEEEGLCVVENSQELVAEPQQPTSFLFPIGFPLYGGPYFSNCKCPGARQ